MLTCGWTTWRLCIFSFWSPFTKSAKVSTMLGLVKLNKQIIKMNTKRQKKGGMKGTCWGCGPSWDEEARHFLPSIIFSECYWYLPNSAVLNRWYLEGKYQLNHEPVQLSPIWLTLTSFLMVVMLKREMWWAPRPSISCTCTRPLGPAKYFFYIFVCNISTLVQVPWEVVQPACFGAGCYIEMATSYHQPHEYKLVGRWTRVFGKKRVVARPLMNQSEKFQRVRRPKFRWRRSRRFGFYSPMARNGPFWPFFGP